MLVPNNEKAFAGDSPVAVRRRAGVMLHLTRKRRLLSLSGACRCRCRRLRRRRLRRGCRWTGGCLRRGERPEDPSMAKSLRKAVFVLLRIMPSPISTCNASWAAVDGGSRAGNGSDNCDGGCRSARRICAFNQAHEHDLPHAQRSLITASSTTEEREGGAEGRRSQHNGAGSEPKRGRALCAKFEFDIGRFRYMGSGCGCAGTGMGANDGGGAKWEEESRERGRNSDSTTNGTRRPRPLLRRDSSRPAST